ncbi:MAG: class I SAM-dependent methyltransferase [Chloroflexi bacterium]|nr:MAG: class I SAM-dependent methyltransferase [Chloroflexota bacterium]
MMNRQNMQKQRHEAGTRMMSEHEDAKRWNRRYAEEGEAWLQDAPRPLLLHYAHLLPRQGLALDAAAGVGRQGLFLAERGLQVIALDISEVGLRLAQAAAKARGVRLETAVYDLSHLWLPPHTFDVILNFRFLERHTFAIYRQSLKPGGLLFFETFVRSPRQTDTPHYYLQPGELRAAFADWEIIHWAEAPETCHHGRFPKLTASLVARKP